MNAQSHHRLVGFEFPQLVGGRSSPPVPLVDRLPLVGDPSAQGHRKKRQNARGQGGSYRQATSISMLPDDVLLGIFDFYRKTDYHPVWKWHLLVHVCQRWRQIVFASPHRLDLRILCTDINPIRENLGIWPVLPIVLRWSGTTAHQEDNAAIAALEHPDRVCVVMLSVTGSQLERIAAMMQVSFPVLTSLDIYSKEENAPVLPAEFLGGAAPCLQKIFLCGIPLPALPTLLLSTSDLVTLVLSDTPKTGYISPEAIFDCVAASPRLRSIHIGFRSATPRPDRIHPPPVIRTVIPALTFFQFQGASEYLEDLVSRIDAPELNELYIDYLNQFVDFQVGQLSQFIHRSVGPKLTLSRHALVTFNRDRVSFDTSRYAGGPHPDPHCAVTSILCRGIDWQVSHMAQVLSQFSATLSNVVHLKLRLGIREHDDEVGVEWLHLLQQFSTMRTLHASWKLGRHVALALEDMTAEMVAEVFPSLDLIYLEDLPASSVEKFVAARKLSGRPVTVFDAEMEFEERLLSY